MSQDLTKRFEGGTPFEKRVIAEFAALRAENMEIRGEITGIRGEIIGIRGEITGIRGEITEIRVQQAAMARNIASLDQRLTSLEEKVDTRLKETRPIWEAVKAQIEKLDEKFTLFIRDLYDIRGDIVGHGKRLEIIERRLQS